MPVMLVDDLARVGVDEDELAHVDAVADLDLPRQVILPVVPCASPVRYTYNVARVACSRDADELLKTAASAVPRAPSALTDGVGSRAMSGTVVPVTAVRSPA